MNLDQPADNLRAFVKARASLDGADQVTWFTGTTHAMMPAGRFAPLFGFEGYNVARAVEVDGGYDLLTREAVFYTGLRDGDPIDRWANPFTGEEVDVAHIMNDPVNQQFRLDGGQAGRLKESPSDEEAADADTYARGAQQRTTHERVQAKDLVMQD